MENKQETIAALQDLVKSYANTIQRLSLEVSDANTKIKEGLAIDPEFAAIDAQIKELQKRKKAIRERAMEAQNLIVLKDNVKALRKEKKEKKADLSDYLLELERMAEVNEVEFPGGEIKIIKKTAELIKLPKGEKMWRQREKGGEIHGQTIEQSSS